MILVQESKETFFRPLEKQNKRLQYKLKEKKCINCEQEMKDNQKLDYVILTNGRIIWWHHNGKDGVMCPIIK